MPSKSTVRRARQKKRAGRRPSTQAGEFVREEIHHVREGKHGARSAKQAIAIGLSKARRAGVNVPPPEPGQTSDETRQSAKRDLAAGKEKHEPSPRRSRASTKALKREGTQAGSSSALARQARSAAQRRSAADRSEAAEKAAETKGAEGRHAAAKKAVRTRQRHRKHAD